MGRADASGLCSVATYSVLFNGTSTFAAAYNLTALTKYCVYGIGWSSLGGMGLPNAVTVLSTGPKSLPGELERGA